jgi:glucose dehydrogenase
MAKKDGKSESMRKENLGYGMLICALGCVWLAAEMGLLKTTLPIGPAIIIVIGLAILLPWIKKS